MSKNSTDKILLGETRFAYDTYVPFSIAPSDLNEHFYIVGRSGTGKSTFLKHLAIEDMARGAGLCFIDPIGSAAEALLTHVPPERDKDIIYFDAGDTDYPISLNPLYNVAPEDRSATVSGILQMFEGIWHDSGWGPRMESIFRAALHTLVENPHCMRPSLLSVFRLLLDEEFRARAKQDVHNPQVLHWWDFRFDRKDLNSRTRREWVEPVLNKIDALSLDPVIRNIIGRPRNSLDLDQVIKRQQILVVNLAQNKIGFDNASFIGMLLIARIRQAAAKVGDRARPFYLTVDEVHSFPTMELTRIIAQGRHSALYARLAHQNLDQLDPKISSVLRNGCGSLAIFAVGAKDAETIVDDLSSLQRDRTLYLLRKLGSGEAVLRLTQNGAPQPPPSDAVQIIDPGWGRANPHSAINLTRQRFATDRLTAEFQIAESHGLLSPEDRLVWLSRFKAQKRERGRQASKNHRRKKARSARVLSASSRIGDARFSKTV